MITRKDLQDLQIELNAAEKEQRKAYALHIEDKENLENLIASKIATRKWAVLKVRFDEAIDDYADQEAKV